MEVSTCKCQLNFQLWFYFYSNLLRKKPIFASSGMFLIISFKIDKTHFFGEHSPSHQEGEWVSLCSHQGWGRLSLKNNKKCLILFKSKYKNCNVSSNFSQAIFFINCLFLLTLNKKKYLKKVPKARQFKNRTIIRKVDFLIGSIPMWNLQKIKQNQKISWDCSSCFYILNLHEIKRKCDKKTPLFNVSYTQQKNSQQRK